MRIQRQVLEVVVSKLKEDNKQGEDDGLAGEMMLRNLL